MIQNSQSNSNTDKTLNHTPFSSNPTTSHYWHFVRLPLLLVVAYIVYLSFSQLPVVFGSSVDGDASLNGYVLNTSEDASVITPRLNYTDTVTPTSVYTPTATSTPMTPVSTAYPTQTPMPPTATSTPMTPVSTAYPTATPVEGLVHVHAPVTTGEMDTQVMLAIDVTDNLTGLDVRSFQFAFIYDTAVLSFVGATPDGTLSEGWNITTHVPETGQINLAAFGTWTLQGQGTLVYLVFDVIGELGDSTTLNFLDFLFNEGTPPHQTHNGEFSIAAATSSISGQVTYGESDITVGGVTVMLQEAVVEASLADDQFGDTEIIPDESGTTVETDVNGQYEFNVEEGKTYVVSVSRDDVPEGAISALDASRIARCVVGSEPAPHCILLPNDTSGDGTVTAFDAALIGLYLVGLTDEAGNTGTWIFDPISRTHTVDGSDLTGQDYIAYVVGDATGNWIPSFDAGLEPVSPEPLSEANSVLVSLSSTTAAPATSVDMPLTIDALDGREVMAYELQVTFDPSVVQVPNIPFSLPSDITDNWTVVHNVVDNTLNIVAYGLEALPANIQTLLTLHFDVVGELNEQTALTIDNLSVNEDLVLARVNNGSIVVFEGELGEKVYLPVISR